MSYTKVFPGNCTVLFLSEYPENTIEVSGIFIMLFISIKIKGVAPK